MHELAICYQMMKTVDSVCAANNVNEVREIILEIGQLSDVIPSYLLQVWPLAAEDSRYEKTELTIEKIQALARCRQCGTEFPPVALDGVCPECGQVDFDVIKGREFRIKDIVAR